jgi:hypothetical protein
MTAKHLPHCDAADAPPCNSRRGRSLRSVEPSVVVPVQARMNSQDGPVDVPDVVPLRESLPDGSWDTLIPVALLYCGVPVEGSPNGRSWTRQKTWVAALSGTTSWVEVTTLGSCTRVRSAAGQAEPASASDTSGSARMSSTSSSSRPQSTLGSFHDALRHFLDQMRTGFGWGLASRRAASTTGAAIASRLAGAGASVVVSDISGRGRRDRRRDPGRRRQGSSLSRRRDVPLGRRGPRAIRRVAVRAHRHPDQQRRRLRHCCFGEEYASITVDCDSSDGERELGERSREPMPRVNVGGQFVVAAANILDKGVAEADHPYGTDLFETAHRP